MYHYTSSNSGNGLCNVMQCDVITPATEYALLVSQLEFGGVLKIVPGEVYEHHKPAGLHNFEIR